MKYIALSIFLFSGMSFANEQEKEKSSNYLLSSPVCYTTTTDQTEIRTCNIDRFDINHIYKNSIKIEVEEFKEKQLISYETTEGLRIYAVCDNETCKEYNDYEIAKKYLTAEIHSRQKRRISGGSKNFLNSFAKKVAEDKKGTNGPTDKETAERLKAAWDYMQAKAQFVTELVKNELEDQKQQRENRERQQRGDRDRKDIFDRVSGGGKLADRPTRNPGSAGDKMSRSAR